MVRGGWVTRQTVLSIFSVNLLGSSEPGILFHIDIYVPELISHWIQVASREGDVVWGKELSLAEKFLERGDS